MIEEIEASAQLSCAVCLDVVVASGGRFGILTGVYPESCAPANQMRAVAKLPRDFRTYPELMRAAGYFCTNNAKTDYNCDVDPKAIWDGEGKAAHWRARTDRTQPFMAVFNYETTHESRLFSPTPGRVTPLFADFASL